MEYGKVVTKTKRLKVYELAEDVYACVTPNKSWGSVCNGFITRGKGLIYDTFYDLPHCKEMLDVYESIKGDRKPGFVVNSHYNGDHIYGNQFFPDSAIVMHEKVLEEIKGEPISFVENIYAARNDPNAVDWLKYFADCMEGLDFRGIRWQNPDILIKTGSKGIDITLDGMVCQVLNIAPAHSQSDLLLWLPEERVVFTGDIVFEKGGMVAWSEEGIVKWAKALGDIAELNPRVVVAGHGGLCGVDHVLELKAYFDDVLDQFNAMYTPDIEPLELAKKLDIAKYINWLEPERVMTIVESLCRGRRGEPKATFAEVIPKLIKLKEFYDEKYADIKKPWNPLNSWGEE